MGLPGLPNIAKQHLPRACQASSSLVGGLWANHQIVSKTDALGHDSASEKALSQNMVWPTVFSDGVVERRTPSEGLGPSRPLQTTPSKGMGRCQNFYMNNFRFPQNKPTERIFRLWAIQSSSNNPFRGFWAFQVSLSNSFRGCGAFQASSNNPFSEGCQASSSLVGNLWANHQMSPKRTLWDTIPRAKNTKPKHGLANCVLGGGR